MIIVAGTSLAGFVVLGKQNTLSISLLKILFSLYLRYLVRHMYSSLSDDCEKICLYNYIARPIFTILYILGWTA